MIKFNLLDSERAKFGDSWQNLADYLGITRQALHLKNAGETEYKRNEISKIAERYSLSKEKIVEIFELKEEE